MKVKFCGLSRVQDIEAVNRLKPEYIGFVFAKKSRRYITAEQAKSLKAKLSPGIKAVGVFVKEQPEVIAQFLKEGIIDIAQLHGGEDELYIKNLRNLTDKPVIKAFVIRSEKDLEEAKKSTADYILLDSGAGTGQAFNWSWLKNMNREYFLAGGLNCFNIQEVAQRKELYGIDVSSGIETDGIKDEEKMRYFIDTIRKVSENHDKS